MNDTSELLECIEKGFRSGYKRAVDKAVEWLDHNRPIGTGDPEWEDTINEFKKAMNNELQ